MPEPDFDQIARRLIDALPDAFLYRGAGVSSALPGVVEQLRQVWNARGAADIAAYQDQYRREYVEDILVEDVIQKLDR